MTYTLNKSHKILEWSYGWYKKKANSLSEHDLLRFEKMMSDLDDAYLSQNRVEADRLAHQLEQFTKAHFKKSWWQYLLESAIALTVALAAAIVIRQSWFELYEIPTGSMRPTFMEQDRLTVSKTQFGLNIPLETAHFFFDPKNVERTGIVIWSGDGVPLDDTDASYFGLLPYKKRYVKRLMGKPGDTLYFYGGKIYGLDAEGKPIPELLDSPHLENLEHIPFLSFEGVPTSPSKATVLFEQMHQPLGKLSLSKKGELVGEIYNPKKDQWIADQPAAAKGPHASPKTYSDFWGIGNFAMARLLTPEQVAQYPELDTTGLDKGVYYLELTHHPSLSYPKPLLPRNVPSTYVMLNPNHSLIPVKEEHIPKLMQAMYTARFEVKNGYARRYSVSPVPYSSTSPAFPVEISDGIYEFYYGKAYKIGIGGWSSLLPENHPLYNPANLQTLFNLGIEFNTFFSPTPHNNTLFPHRYAYFRNGDLYLLGAPIFKKDEATLAAFNEHEKQKEDVSTDAKPYLAFKDSGPPNEETIRNFGLPLSTKRYLVLGDNHAMSADSRIFGFLPEENLQGVPSIVLWPKPGFSNQPHYPIFTKARLLVWGLALVTFLIWYFRRKKKLSERVFKKM